MSYYNPMTWSLFKTDEEKKAEYEKEIATNVAAMEVQNSANKGSAYSNDPRFQRPAGPAAVDPLRGKKYGPNTMVYKNNGQYSIADGSVNKLTGKPFKEINYQEQNTKLQDEIDIDIAENNNLIRHQNKTGQLNAPSLMSMGYIERNPTTVSDIAAQPYSIAQQTQLRNAERLKTGIPVGMDQWLKPTGETPAATEALGAATGGVDYMSLLKILGMFNSGNQKQSNVKPGITPGVTPGVAGSRIQEEDLYGKYRR
tara:strand:- start:5815 stop:6579 length:765 start_codon:yes stop_codon:yes gene_type:complete